MGSPFDGAGSGEAPAPVGFAQFKGVPTPALDEAGSCSAEVLANGAAYPTATWQALLQQARGIGFAPPSTSAGCVDETRTRGVLTARTVSYQDGQPLEEQRWTDDGAPLSSVSHVFEDGRELARETWTPEGGTVDEAWTYDANGRIATHTGPGYQDTWRYGDQGRPALIARAGDSGLQLDGRFAYDDQGRFSSLTWTLVDEDRLTEETKATYHPSGAVASLSFSTEGMYGMTRDDQFDAAGRLTAHLTSNGEASVTSSYAYPDGAGFDVATSVQYGALAEEDQRDLRWGEPGGPRPLQAGYTTHKPSDAEPTVIGREVVTRVYDESGRLWLETFDEDGDCRPERTRTLRYDPSGVLREDRTVAASGAVLSLRTLQGSSCSPAKDAARITDWDAPERAPTQAELLGQLTADPG
jgi:hypothetical protein